MMMVIESDKTLSMMLFIMQRSSSLHLIHNDSICVYSIVMDGSIWYGNIYIPVHFRNPTFQAYVEQEIHQFCL